MKKLKLLFAAFALLLGVSNAMAQKDVTSQYITNATLSSLTGWTKSNFNNPVNAYHVDENANPKVYSNATTGYASEAYAGWDDLSVTSFHLTQTITLPAGHYTLVNYSFFRQGQSYNTNTEKSLAFLKAGNNQVAIKTLGSISAAGYANSQWEGAGCFDSKMYRNTLDFTIESNNTEIEIGLVGTFDEKRSWCIVGQFELINNDIAATMDSPFDVTGYIVNPGFEYRDMTGWTLSENGAFGTQNNNQSFKTAWYYGEKWQASGALTARSMSQTLTNLPAGYYKLTANLGGNGTYIDLNGNRVSWTEDKDYTVGYVLSGNENLTITAGKTAEGTANWIHFDNFRLQFCGDVAEALNTLIAQKTTYEGLIPSTAYNALVAAVNAYDKDYSDIDELLAAIDAVQGLYNDADLLKPDYSAWLKMKGLADDLVEVENNNPSANGTFASAISTQNTAAEGATTASAISTATSALKAAMITYVGAADPTSGNRFDLTFMIAVPDMTDLWTGAWGVVPDGWATEQEGGNFQVMQNNDADAEDGIHKVFTEYYYLNNNKTWGNDKFNVYTTIAALPVGTYTMSCYAFAKEQNYSSGNPVPAVYFYANDTQGTLVNNSRLSEKSISFINDEQQDVKVGLKPLTGNTLNWMGIGYVKLYKEYTDNTTYDINTGVVANGSVAVTVDGDDATSAKALKTVTLTYSPNDGYAVSSVVASYNDGKEKTLDVANPSTNVYTFQMPAYDVTVTSSIVVDKSALATAITNATNARKSANEGTGVFQIPAAAGTTLASAITDAQDVYDNGDATVSEVATAVTTINGAIETYEATTLNAPAAGDVFNVMITTGDDYAFKNNPLTFNADNASGAYFPQGIGVKAYRAQQITFTQVEGNKYTLSMVNADGNRVYIGTNKTINNTGEYTQIRLTTDGTKALAVKVEPTATAGVYKLWNTEADALLGCQDDPAKATTGGIYTCNSHSDFTITAASKPSVSMAIASGVKYATRIFPFAPTSYPNNIVFYSCAAASGSELTLQVVGSPKANVPYILFAEDGSDGSVSGFGSATETSYTEGWLTGVYEDTKATAGTYVLQNLDDKVAFYLVAEGEEPTVGANRCYLTKSAGARSAYFFPGTDITGIKAVNALNALTSGKVQIFNASGAQIPALQKGMNIIRMEDGTTQKVMVE